MKQWSRQLSSPWSKAVRKVHDKISRFQARRDSPLPLEKANGKLTVFEISN